MRAWQVQQHDEPAAALALCDLERPTPGPGQVLVRVRTAALNFPDVLLARGRYQERPELPFVPGVEFCGDLVEFGPPSPAGQEYPRGVSLGDRVVGTTVMPHGSLAEYALADAGAIFLAPAELDDAHAAALTVAYQTAWVGLHRRARLQAGETVLVHAAAGGVGGATVQLAKAAGARVVGVVGGAEKVSVARRLGADVVIDRSTIEPAGDERAFVAALRQACEPGGADVVMDPVGGQAFSASTRVVAFEGRILVVGFAGGTIAQAATNHALIKNYGVLGVYWGLYQHRAPEVTHAAALMLSELVTAGRVTPEVSRVIGFRDAPQGLAELAAGRTVGRLVVQVAGDPEMTSAIGS